MKKKWLAGMLFVAGCGMQEPERAEESDQSRQPESRELAAEAENLDTPWSIEQSEGIFYISERSGTIARVENGQVEHQPVELTSPLSDASEAGLLGFVLAPDFTESKEAYAYYTYDKEGKPYNRIVRLKQEESDWHEVKTILDEIPSGSFHHGGRLERGPDGALYATIGDASNPETAQDPESWNGKIVRINESDKAEIYSMGHRNPQGIAWAADGTMYASEHGQSANDEINRVERGKNYGWPDIEGTEKAEGLEAPLAASGPDNTWAPSGMTWHKGALYTASLRGEAVLEIDPQTGEVSQKVDGYGRIRDVFSDGEQLYFVTNNTDGRGNPAAGDDKLYRIAE
ncbi:PQQ-dependent sugar dehydrogenase [Domibacillus robiginosus]|uniref:PQQ-dependent sugar dehydrogenase n=1 Tax=Domibacillus robiginosus TaxID=1071054 RepID=UPI00067C653A|nr:PQQ-dependent sugar dehydrogenase [Domibacillus robiginosus]